MFRVLVIDDEPEFIGKVLPELSRYSNFVEVDCAGSPDNPRVTISNLLRALSALKNNNYDLILLDMQMPIYHDEAEQDRLDAIWRLFEDTFFPIVKSLDRYTMTDIVHDPTSASSHDNCGLLVLRCALENFRHLKPSAFYIYTGHSSVKDQYIAFIGISPFGFTLHQKKEYLASEIKTRMKTLREEAFGNLNFIQRRGLFDAARSGNGSYRVPADPILVESNMQRRSFSLLQLWGMEILEDPNFDWQQATMDLLCSPVRKDYESIYLYLNNMAHNRLTENTVFDASSL